MGPNPSPGPIQDPRGMAGQIWQYIQPFLDPGVLPGSDQMGQSPQQMMQDPMGQVGRAMDMGGYAAMVGGNPMGGPPGKLAQLLGKLGLGQGGQRAFQGAAPDVPYQAALTPDVPLPNPGAPTPTPHAPIHGTPDLISGRYPGGGAMDEAAMFDDFYANNPSTMPEPEDMTETLKRRMMNDQPYPGIDDHLELDYWADARDRIGGSYVDPSALDYLNPQELVQNRMSQLISQGVDPNEAFQAAMLEFSDLAPRGL